MDSIGARILAYLRYCAIKPIILLIAVQAGIFLPCAILADSIDPASFLDCDPSIWHGEIWRPFTAIFTHESTSHFILNMLILLLIGHWFFRALGTRGFWWTAILAGSIANVLHTFIFPQPVLGFSGAFSALLVAATIKQPQTRIFIFPAWLFVSVFFFIDLINFIVSLRPGHVSTVAYDVHVMGGILGAVLILIAPRWQALRKKWHDQHLAQEAQSYAKEQERVDEILEKISQHGLHTISEAERKYLKKHSENERKRKESNT